VRDTTGLEIGEWVDRRGRTTRNKGINVKTDIEVEIEEVRPAEEAMDSEMAEEDEESDEEVESVGFELNQRLIQAAAMREQGVSVVMDPEWEQFLKEAQEREALGRQELGIQASGAAAPRSLRPALASAIASLDAPPMPPNPSIGPAS